MKSGVQEIQQLKIGYFGRKTAVFIKSGGWENYRAQNRQSQMKNRCFYEIRCLGGPESSKSAILNGKELFLRNHVFGRSRALKIGNLKWKTAVFIKSVVQEAQRALNRLFQMENSCFYKIRWLGGPQSSKSAILDENPLFFMKLGGQEVQRA